MLRTTEIDAISWNCNMNAQWTVKGKERRFDWHVSTWLSPSKDQQIEHWCAMYNVNAHGTSRVCKEISPSVLLFELESVWSKQTYMLFLCKA